MAATELITGVSGESEERIRDLFEQAAMAAPCVLFIDEIDAISSNRMNASKDMERRIVAQLLICLDGLANYENGAQVLVIGATNRAESLDPALRRVGRFDQEISLGIPDRDARCDILRIICADLKLEKLFDFDKIAVLTPGYVGADLLALTTRAASLAIKRAYNEKQEYTLKTNVSQIKQKYEIPVVNLTDDILMEIDSVLEANRQFDVPNETDNEKTVETSVGEKPNEEVIAETPSTENGIETAGGSKDENVHVDEIKPVEEKPAEEKPAEEIIAEEKTAEGKPETVVDHPKITDTPAEKNVTVVNDDIEIVDGENNNLGDALLQNSAIKQTLGLDVMLKWLSNVEPLITRSELTKLYITMDDFKDACKLVQPSAKREGFITVPDVTWENIGSLQDIRQELQLAILAPVKYPQRLKVLGIKSPSGVLLCGPPGTHSIILNNA